MRCWQALVFGGEWTRILQMPESAGRPLLAGVGPSGSSSGGAMSSGGCRAAGGSCTLGGGAFRSGGCGLGVAAPPLPHTPACPEAPGRVAQASVFPGWTRRSRWVQGTWICVLSWLSVSTRAGPPPHPTPPHTPTFGRPPCPQGQDWVPTPWQPCCCGPTAQVPPGAAQRSPPLQWSSLSRQSTVSPTEARGLSSGAGCELLYVQRRAPPPLRPSLAGGRGWQVRFHGSLMQELRR